MGLSPKDQFRQTTDAKNWKAAVESEWFRNGLTAALAQMVINSGPTGNEPYAAAAAFNRMEGAKAMVNAILTLTDAPPKPVTPPNHNLTPV